MTERRVRGDRGVSSIELAVIAPSLLFLIFLVIQAGLFFYARSVALQAAREGVSQLRLAQTQVDCAGMSGRVESNTSAFAAKIGALQDVTTHGDCGRYRAGGGSTVTVQVRGNAISLLGITLPVSQSATGQVEQFQDEG